MKRLIIAFVSIFIIHVSNQAQHIQLVFRFDDFIMKSESLNESIVRKFIKYDTPIVLGVIPYDKSEERIFIKSYNFLPVLQNGVRNHSIEIALHGLNHCMISSDGEFGKIKYDEQFRRIKKGKMFLDSLFETSVKTFSPPWNNYDENTLSVLQALDFQSISPALCVNQPFANTKLNYYPHTVYNFKDLKSVLHKNSNRNCIVVLMFHRYDLCESFTLDSIDSVLSYVKKLSSVRTTTFKALCNEGYISNSSRISANLEINLLSKKLCTSNAIQTTSFAVFLRLINLVGYLCLSILIFVLSIWLFQLKYTKDFLFFVFPLFVCGLIVWGHYLSPMKSLIVAVILPLLVVLVVRIIKSIFFYK